MSSTKISNMEAIFLVVVVMLNHIVMNLPKSLLDHSGSSSILNIVFIFAIVLCIVYFICKVMERFPNQDILDISEFLGGKFLKCVIATIFLLYFLFVVTTFLRSFCESLKIVYFPRTPVFFLLLFFVIGAVLCNRLGFSAIARANLIFIPLTLFSIIFIFLANVENFTLERMFPLFGNGIATTFFSGLSNLYAFGGLSLLYFLPPHLKEAKSYKKIAFTSIILSGLWLLFSIITLLFIFPSIVTTDEIFPLYLASRFIEFGRFFQRLDSVFLFIWIISVIAFISILINLMVQIFRKTTHFKYQYASIYLFAVLLLLMTLIPHNYAQIHFLETTVYQYIVLIVNFGVSLPLLLFAYLKHKRQKKFQEKGE